MKLKYLSLFTVLLVFSCQNSTEEVNTLASIIEVESYEPLLGKEVKAFGEGCFAQIEVLDNTLLLLDRCSEEQFKVYTLDGEFKNTFGAKGNGPNEFQFAEIGNRENGGIWVHDINKRRLKFFDKENIFNGEGYPTKETIILAGLIGGFELSEIKPGVFAGKDHIEGKGSFFIYNSVDESKRWFPFGPKVSKDPDPDKVSLLYNTLIAYEASKESLVVAFTFFNRLEIYNAVGDLKKEITIGDELDPDFKTPSRWMVPNKAVKTFMGLKLTDKAIYGLYSGLRQEEIVDEDGYRKSLSSSILYVIDWDGNLKGAYEFDKYLNAFAVENDRFIYGIAEDDSLGVKKVYKFDLK